MSTGSGRRACAEDRHGRAVAERLVKATLVVEGDPFANARPSFAAVGVALEVDVPVLERAPQPFEEDLVHLAAAAVHRDANAGGDQTPVNAAPVNWMPWSVLKISGRSCRASASSEASTQNEASMVLDSRHDSVARLAQFEGQAEGNPQAKRGYSRDHRPDCKQVCIALVVTFDGFPLRYEVFAGITHNSQTLQTIVAAMEARHGAFGRVWITDRAMVSAKNLAWLRETGRR